MEKTSYEELHDMCCSPNIMRAIKIAKNAMGWACSAGGKGERHVQGFGGET
jgi:hypothetical protein